MAEEEIRRRLLEALGSINTLAREVLVLGHFAEMSNVGTARALGIGTDAQSSSAGSSSSSSEFGRLINSKTLLKSSVQSGPAGGSGIS